MKKGFTLIELVMVIVILGILAATALPRFVDLSSKAKESATRGSLGGIRAALAIAYASNAAYGTAGWPTTISQNLFADNNIPMEPFDNTNAIAAGSNPSGTTGGWMYDSTSGRVWVNNSNYSTY